MKKAWLVVVGLILGGCATYPYLKPDAMADLRNAKGDVVGIAALWEEEAGVRFFADVRGISSGKHGVHLHAVGKCDPPDFTTAGAHFNPEGKKHGLMNPEGPHAGDLPNLNVAPDGTGQLHYVARRVTLGAGPASLFGADGTAVVIHAGADDEITDPTGNSGGRVACGIIRKAS